jgi:hypothetical protein
MLSWTLQCCYNFWFPGVVTSVTSREYNLNRDWDPLYLFEIKFEKKNYCFKNTCQLKKNYTDVWVPSHISQDDNIRSNSSQATQYNVSCNISFAATSISRGRDTVTGTGRHPKVNNVLYFARESGNHFPNHWTFVTSSLLHNGHPKRIRRSCFSIEYLQSLPRNFQLAVQEWWASGLDWCWRLAS